MALRSVLLLALALVPAVTGHGTVTKPAMRDTGRSKYCPWCQGSQDECGPTSAKQCDPPTPCWGDIPGTMVSKKYFGKWKDLTLPDGTPWIDNGDADEQAAGAGGSIPMWCPGDVVPSHTFINADHNGVYRWESQLASPGKEVEKAFVNFTEWTSINQDPDADFYSSDGKTKLTPGKCYPPGKCTTWTPSCSHCRNNAFSKTLLTLPKDMPAGETVLRWFWYGAMKTDGEHVHGPEHSLFVNCKDVVIGTAEQCKSRSESHDVVV